MRAIETAKQINDEIRANLQPVQAQIVALRAENARLREALVALVEAEKNYRLDTGETTAAAIDTAIRKAATLTGESK